jgi:hypothetical protein
LRSEGKAIDIAESGAQFILRRFLLLVGYSLFGLLSVGLIFHTSSSRTLLNKYSVAYFLFLLIVLVTGVSLRRIFRFFSEPSTLSGNRGKHIQIRPLHKIVGYGLLGLVCLMIIELPYRSRQQDELSASLLQYHPFLQNVLHTKGGGGINSHGFRGNEISKRKSEGSIRIFMIGGSSVLSSGVPFEQCHSVLLEQMLSESYPNIDIEVQNAGNHWHTTAHSLVKYLLHIKDYDPDIVILWHGINDLCRSFSPELYAAPGYRSDYGHFYGATSRMVQSHFAALRKPLRIQLSLLAVKDAWQYVSDAYFSDFRTMDYSSPLTPAPRDANGKQVDTFVSLAAFQRNLSSFSDILESDGVTLVLATQPYLYKNNMNPAERKACWFHLEYCLEDGAYPDLSSMQQGMILFNSATRQVATQHGIPLLELDAAIPKTMDYFRDDCHYTPEGSRAVAAALHAFIREKNILSAGKTTERLSGPDS